MASGTAGASSRTSSLARALADKIIASLRPAGALEPVPSLRGESGPAAGRVYRLTAPSNPLAGSQTGPRQRWLLGRGAECDIVILDIDLSRIHAAIDRVQDDGADGRFVAIDLGSKNGTSVASDIPGDRAMTRVPLVPMTPHPLDPGALLHIGSSVLRLDDPHEAYRRALYPDGDQAAPPARSHRNRAREPSRDRAIEPSSWRPGRALRQLLALSIALAALAGLAWLFV